MSEIKVDSIGPRVDSGTLTIGASGDTVNIAGTAGTGFPAGTTLSGSTNNQITTVTGANAIQGESSLTFDGTTLLSTSGASGATANSSANNVVADGNSASGNGISILSKNDSNGSIFFGDAQSNSKCIVKYDHSTDLLKLDTAAATAFIMNQDGIITKPLQPAFLTAGAGGSAPAIATQSNPFATVMTEIYDKNSDLSSSAIFTAPVTGTYVFYMHTKYTSSDGENFSHYFKASNRNQYFMNVKALNTVNAGSNTQWVSGSSSVDMDANDTMQIRTDWEATANRNRNTDPDWTYFSGYLLC